MSPNTLFYDNFKKVNYLKSTSKSLQRQFQGSPQDNLSLFILAPLDSILVCIFLGPDWMRELKILFNNLRRKFKACHKFIYYININSSLGRDCCQALDLNIYHQHYKQQLINRSFVTTSPQPQYNLNLNYGWVGHENDFAYHPVHPPN